MKSCNKCSEVKNLDDFYKDKANIDGRRNQCKGCDNLKTNKWRKDNVEQYNHSMTQYVRENYQKVRLYQYGITEDQWQEMFKNQNGTCAICKQPETLFDSRLQKTRQLSVDHCHETGKVRGLLCGKCNKGLGLFSEDIEILQKAINYLS